VPAPRLLAFGQRSTGPTSAEWFTLYEAPSGISLERWRSTTAVADRRPTSEQVWSCLRKLHDSGCLLVDPAIAFSVSDEGVAIADPAAIRIVKQASDRDRQRDWHAVRRLVGVE
jgi:hypothetical protein